MVWSKGAGKRRKKKSHSGRDRKAESVETAKRCQEIDQVELLPRRLLDDAYLQKRRTSHMGTDEKRSGKADQEIESKV